MPGCVLKLEHSSVRRLHFGQTPGASERVVVSLMQESNLRINQANSDILAASPGSKNIMAPNAALRL